MYSVFVSGDYVLEEVLQRGYIPLPVADVVEQAPLRLLLVYLELFIKRPACDDNPQIGVKHHKGLVDSIHDSPCKGVAQLCVCKRIASGRRSIYRLVTHEVCRIARTIAMSTHAPSTATRKL